MRDILCLGYHPRIKVNANYFISNVSVTSIVAAASDDIDNVLKKNTKTRRDSSIAKHVSYAVEIQQGPLKNTYSPLMQPKAHPQR